MPSRLTASRAIERARDLAAFASPAAMACRLDPNFAVRAHGRLISRTVVQVEAGEVNRALITLPPQVGKPVYLNTLILMGDGSRKRLADIEVGDHVITHHGRPRRVEAVHEQGDLPCLTITTYSGRTTTAALDHPFLTPEGWVKAEDLTVGQCLAAVPAPTTDHSGTITIDEARLMGYFIGDGSTSGHMQYTSKGVTHAFNAVITSGSKAATAAILDAADACGFTAKVNPNTGRNHDRINLSGGVRPWLARHDIALKNSHTKRVPTAVFTASPEIIAAFLGAYWDCDGSVTTRGKLRDGTDRTDVLVEIYTVARELAEDVQHLLLRLGINSVIRVKNSLYKGDPYTSYRVAIHDRDGVAMFRELITLTHEKRAAKLAGHPHLRTRFEVSLIADPIASIEAAGNMPCRCLTIAEDHTFTTGDLVVHNSTMAVQWGAFWWLARHPDHRLMIVSYAASLAIDHGKVVRRLIRDHGHRYGLFLERGSQAADNFRLTTGGGVRCVGVDGGATGFGARLVLADDMFKNRKQAESLRERDNVDAFWSSSLMSRLAPGAPVMLTMTLWHPDDIGGRVVQREGDREQGGRWLVLKCPALATSADDPLGRSIGEPLPHPLVPDGDTDALMAHWLNAKSTSSVRDWFALYQCDPKPLAGALITEAALRAARHFSGQPQQLGAAVAVDPSGGGKDTAGIIGGFLGADKRLYVTDDETAVMSVDKWPRKACELAARIKASRIIVETDFGGKMGPTLIKTAWEAMRREWEEEQADTPEQDRPDNPYAGFCPRLVTKRASQMGNKLVRAEPIAQQIIEDRVRFGKYLPDVESEWATLQSHTESPGRVDAIVWLCYDMLSPPSTGKNRTVAPTAVDRRDVARRRDIAGPRINRD